MLASRPLASGLPAMRWESTWKTLRKERFSLPSRLPSLSLLRSSSQPGFLPKPFPVSWTFIFCTFMLFFSYHPPAWNPSSFQNPPGITFKTHLHSQAFPGASSSPLLQGGSAPPSVLGCVMVMMALEEGREMVVDDHYWPRGTVLSALQSLFQLIFTTTL